MTATPTRATTTTATATLPRDVQIRIATGALWPPPPTSALPAEAMTKPPFGILNLKGDALSTAPFSYTWTASVNSLDSDSPVFNKRLPIPSFGSVTAEALPYPPPHPPCDNSARCLLSAELDEFNRRPQIPPLPRRSLIDLHAFRTRVRWKRCAWIRMRYTRTLAVRCRWQ